MTIPPPPMINRDWSLNINFCDVYGLVYLFTRPTHRNSWEHLTCWHLYRTHAYWNYFFRYHQIQRSLQLWLEIPWAAVCSARCGLVPSQTSRATRGHSPKSFAVRQGPGTQTLFWCTGETWSGWFLENMFDKETFEYSQTVFHRSVERELKRRGKKITQKPAVTEQEVPSLARPYSAFPPQSSLVIALDERKGFFQTLRTETKIALWCKRPPKGATFQTFHRTSTRLFLMFSFGILRGIFAHRRPKLTPSRIPDVWALSSWTKRKFSFLTFLCSFFRNTVFHRYFGDYAFSSFTSENLLITD